MTKIHMLDDRRLEPQAGDGADRSPSAAAEPEGELVPLPFIDLPTVVKTVKMLRKFPDQTVLDNFNCTKPSASAS